MVKILPYDPKVEGLWATPRPAEIVGLACSTTQKGIYTRGANSSPELISFLYSAGHGNPLEHAVICLDITQISRACADQLRTHRTCSPTMSSTHYQDHSSYPHRVAVEMVNDPAVRSSIEKSVNTYEQLIDHYGKGSARQLLPLSTEVRYMLTINARSLAHLLSLRMCYRNTIETILCAERMHYVAHSWFPELFSHVGRPCNFKGCHENKMRCDFIGCQEELQQYV